MIGERTWSRLLDLLVFAAVLAAIQGLLVIAHYWFGAITPAAQISRSPRALPLYAFYSRGAHRRGLRAQPDLRRGVRLYRGVQPARWKAS